MKMRNVITAAAGIFGVLNVIVGNYGVAILCFATAYVTLTDPLNVLD